MSDSFTSATTPAKHLAEHQYFDSTDFTGTLTNDRYLYTSGGLVTLTATSPAQTNFTVVVASSDAPAAVQSAADYVCDGTADEIQINSAIDQAARLNSRSGPVGAEQLGVVQLTGGQFTLAAPILVRTGVWLRGMGVLTQLIDNNISSSAGAGTNVAMIKLNDTSDHLVRVSHMWLDGNTASGGAGHGIAFETGSGTHSTYPDSNPDPDIWVHDLFIRDFTTGTRHGIFMDDDMRGSMIYNNQIRVCSGNGIYMLGSPDSHIHSNHIGGVDLAGIAIAGGNNKLTNNKAYYCDTWGFNITSGRAILTGNESQDNASGFNLSANHIAVAGAIVDTHSTDGVVFDADHINATGIVVFQRSTGRYASCTNGVRMVSGSTNCHVSAVVDPTDITNEYTGTWSGTANWIRISDGGSLYTVGA